MYHMSCHVLQTDKQLNNHLESMIENDIIKVLHTHIQEGPSNDSRSDDVLVLLLYDLNIYI